MMSGAILPAGLARNHSLRKAGTIRIAIGIGLACLVERFFRKGQILEPEREVPT
jgi:hypothetical protein